MKDYEPEFKDLRKIIILDRVHFIRVIRKIHLSSKFHQMGRIFPCMHQAPTFEEILKPDGFSKLLLQNFIEMGL